MKRSFPIYELNLNENKACYFIADTHLFSDKQQEKEKILSNFLTQIKTDAQYLFLLGDIFDFWFEYKHLVPRGYTRFFGKLGDLADAGVEIHFFKGNHDMWTRDYFVKEFNAHIWDLPVRLIHGNLVLEVGHGDGLGPGDYGYKILKFFIRSPFVRFLFSCLPSSISFPMAYMFSKQSRYANEKYKNSLNQLKEKEYIIEYIRLTNSQRRANIYIFGHRHRFFDLMIDDSRYINLGFWDFERTYVRYDGEIQILKW
ncbi:MAG: UDP-2,3-diacylglucosamine diphosphatase [Bacteroidales bacterium]|nr:UDP-2,3-diacylglucosamine diphosphatase [Bacteroidales bacterium]